MDAQHIIIGGGCAGMQVLQQLLKQPHEQTGDILLIERENSVPEKSWCFWSNQATAYDFLVSKRWQSLQFGAPGRNLVENIAPYAYHYINSEDFFNFHYELIHQSSRVKIIHESVTEILNEDGKFKVKTNLGEHHAPIVMNSVADSLHSSSKNILLWQHFYGWFIQTEEPVFDEHTATLMDFSLEQGPGANFMYVLPFSANTALLEFTAFSNAASYDEAYYTTQLESYIKNRWNTAFKIERTESGKIPMSNFNFPITHPSGALNIGSAAGAIKPTTGYAFKRIMRDTQQIIEMLQSQKPRTEISRQRFKFYDQLLLQIIQHEPLRVREIMTKLFARNNWIDVLQFLDEDSDLIQEISIFSSLPKRLFLKQVFRYAFGR